MISLIEQATSLFPLPDTVSDILELLNNPQSTVRQIAQLITKDVALTARVLRLANSAYYGAARRVDSVSAAVTLLGFDVLKGYVLASSSMSTLAKALPFYGLNRDELWQHSERVANMAIVVGQELGIGSLGAAYAAGLLHDIGKVVVNQAMTGSASARPNMAARRAAPTTTAAAEAQIVLPQLAMSRGMSLVQAERQVISMNHDVIGFSMAERWKLPPTLVDGIGCHHEPRRAQHDPEMAALVHLADFCVHQTEAVDVAAKTTARALYALEPSALDVLSITFERVDELVAACQATPLGQAS